MCLLEACEFTHMLEVCCLITYIKKTITKTLLMGRTQKALKKKKKIKKKKKKKVSLFFFKIFKKKNFSFSPKGGLYK